MEKYTMFMDGKNQYSENEYTNQSIYRFNAIPIKLPMVIFHRTRKNKFIICKKKKNTLTSLSSLEKEEWNWRNQAA